MSAWVNALDSELEDLEKAMLTLKQKRSKQRTLTSHLHALQLLQSQDPSHTTSSPQPTPRTIVSKQNILNAFRFSGISIKTIGTYHGIRIDSSVKGKFYDRFYVILDTAANSSLFIHKHTCPYFIPIARLAKEHLENPNGVRLFAQALEEHLSAFVSRREQWKAALAKFDQLEDVTVSHAMDFISFRLNSIHAELRFSNLLLHSPDKVHLENSDIVPDFHLSLVDGIASLLQH
eukprot:c5562_g1_i2.p1 GENE.c5562_g1_i2~~c5562_g1_i2.p1  ORF type:complete len:233 (+),score=53.22 c5562_g1_i2:29-727(+)